VEKGSRAFEPHLEALALGAAVYDLIYIHLFACYDQIIRLQLHCIQMPFNTQREEEQLTTLAATAHRDIEKRILKNPRQVSLSAVKAQLVQCRTSKALMIDFKVTVESKAMMIKVTAAGLFFHLLHLSL
jgi:hypothetical protein